MESLLEKADAHYRDANIGKALTLFEKAFFICDPEDQYAKKISKIGVFILREFMVHFESEEVNRKLYPAFYFEKTGQDPKTIHDLIDWEMSNDGQSKKSKLQIAKWYNALGDTSTVKEICLPYLLMPSFLEFHIENAIANLQVGDYVALRVDLKYLKGSKDPNIIEFTQNLSREFFFQECLRVEGISQRQIPPQNFQWQ